jgi:hypothetical protein
MRIKKSDLESLKSLIELARIEHSCDPMRPGGKQRVAALLDAAAASAKALVEMNRQRSS